MREEEKKAYNATDTYGIVENIRQRKLGSNYYFI
jgi:hypothetical protein